MWFLILFFRLVSELDVSVGLCAKQTYSHCRKRLPVLSVLYTNCLHILTFCQINSTAYNDGQLYRWNISCEHWLSTRQNIYFLRPEHSQPNQVPLSLTWKLEMCVSWFMHVRARACVCVCVCSCSRVRMRRSTCHD